MQGREGQRAVGGKRADQCRRGGPESNRGGEGQARNGDRGPESHRGLTGNRPVQGGGSESHREGDQKRREGARGRGGGGQTSAWGEGAREAAWGGGGDEREKVGNPTIGQ